MQKSGLLISSTNFNQIPLSRLQFSVDNIKYPIRRSGTQSTNYTTCFMRNTIPPSILLSSSDPTIVSEPSHTHGIVQFLNNDITETPKAVSEFMQSMVLLDLDPTTAKLAIGFLGPFLSAFGFLFISRIVMSWYPKLPVEKFPYVVAYAPTEPLLVPTRKLIPPVGGVDVTPVVWFGLISFLNEILVGPQGLLVLLSQQV